MHQGTNNPPNTKRFQWVIGRCAIRAIATTILVVGCWYVLRLMGVTTHLPGILLGSTCMVAIYTIVDLWSLRKPTHPL